MKGGSYSYLRSQQPERLNGLHRLRPQGPRTPSACSKVDLNNNVSPDALRAFSEAYASVSCHAPLRRFAIAERAKFSQAIKSPKKQCRMGF